MSDVADRDFSVLANLIDSSCPDVSNGMTALVIKDGKEIFFHANGSIEELGFTYERNTLFDVASLTKPIVTSTLIFDFLDRGIISLEDTLEMIPELGRYNNLRKFTIRSLLSHTSGLVPHMDLYYRGKNRAGYLSAIEECAVNARLYSEEEYSDLNYILLGFALEELGGKALNVLFNERVAKPHGLSSMTFNPSGDISTIAPTEVTNERGLVRGKVHDENSFYLGGVAGHAGLFSTVDDLANFLRLYTSHMIVSKASVDAATTPQNEYLGGTFGYGWVINASRRERQSPAFDHARFLGDISPHGVFGHTGFTGTSVLVDRTNDLICVLLTNRVYPTRTNLKILHFRRIFHNALYSVLSRS